MTQLSRAAQFYAAMGLPIFGLAEGTKIPTRGSHGWKDAAPDASPWIGRPKLNIGLAVAKSRLVLIDEDVAGAVAATGWDLPPTWAVEATRGPHRYYLVPEGRDVALVAPSGVDVIDLGYGVLPPSVHPNGHRYRWAKGLNPWSMLRPAMLPYHLTGVADDMRTDDYGEPDGEASDSFLGAAFSSLGWLGPKLGEGKYAVRCPWADQHSKDTGPSSTVIFAPREGSPRIGSFSCRHGHCKGRRTPDVIEVLPRDALIAAAKAGYRRELVIIGNREKRP